MSLHHVSAMASDAVRTRRFYTELLGLRLVKTTVNFDDPSAYHLYFGDRAGRPGTVLTFFPYPNLPRGRAGVGQAVEVVFAVPLASFGSWIERFLTRGQPYAGPESRLGEKVLRITDPDGLQIELCGLAEANEPVGYWPAGGVSPDAAIRGLHAITLWEQGYEGTAALLTEALGYARGPDDGSRFRFLAPGDGPGRIVDLRCLPGFWAGGEGAGTVHHVAFRARDDAHQLDLRRRLVGRGLDVTPVLDRHYFRSIYFREPGGVLFEIATDGPGFLIDESDADLGATLRLPPRLEPLRAEVIEGLPPLP